MDTAIVGIDPAGMITEWSVGAENMMGWTRSQAIAQPFALLFTPEDQRAGLPESLLRSGNAQASDEAHHSHCERWHATQSGGRVWAGAELVTRIDGQGWVMLLRDRSRLRRVSAAQRESHRLNTLIMNSTRDCIIVLDLQARIEVLSPGAAAVFTAAIDGNPIGTPWLALWRETDAKEAEAALADALAGRDGRFRGFAPTGEGKPKWWDVVISPLPGPDGKPERLVTIGRDITERTLAEQRLAISEERLSLALAASELIGTFDYDMQHSTLYADANFARLHGVDAARAAAGLPIHEVLGCFHPDDAEPFKAQIRRLLAGSDTFALEHRLIQRDGGNVWVLVRGRLRRDAKGQPLRLSGALVDITDHQQSEARLQLLMQESAHRVKNAMAVVQSMARQTLRGDGEIAVKREAFIDRLLALAAAHDVLLQRNRGGASLRVLVEAACRVHANTLGERFAITGQEVTLGSKAALAFALVLHEMMTNAAKYGSLSAPEGRVHVGWTLARDDEKTVLHFCWQESGGPTVHPPSTSGFGRRLIERSLAMELGADAKLDYLAGGVRLDFTVPLPALQGE